MKIKTEELIGAALDWAVAKCESTLPPSYDDWTQRWPRYSTDWALGGPIIERENITVVCCEGDWVSGTGYSKFWVAKIGQQTVDESYGPQGDPYGYSYSIPEDAIQGPTPLIAAMRCFVASKLGGAVEVPDEVA